MCEDRSFTFITTVDDQLYAFELNFYKTVFLQAIFQEAGVIPILLENVAQVHEWGFVTLYESFRTVLASSQRYLAVQGHTSSTLMSLGGWYAETPDGRKEMSSLEYGTFLIKEVSALESTGKLIVIVEQPHLECGCEKCQRNSFIDLDIEQIRSFLAE